MKVGIYGPYFGTMGGGELYLGAIAEILSHDHDVQIVSETELSLEHYGRFFGLDLSRVRVRIVPRIPFVESLNPLLPGRTARYRKATEFTEDYDLFILMPRNFRIPYETRSRHSILHLQVPDRPWSAADFAGALTKGAFVEFRNQLVKLLRYPSRYARFDAVLINSEFHRNIIAGRLKNPHAVVLPPPISLKTPRPWREKENLILGVGRFFRGLHSKRHDLLIQALKKITLTYNEWRLALAGGLNEDPDAQEYFSELQGMASGLPVEFLPNIPLERLNDLYSRARIFWHAAGFGADKRSPERMEHFGISTVEAMSAGCIPVVFRGGGQQEIVQHGIHGMLWDTEEQLRATTAKIFEMKDEAEGLSAAAIEHSKEYGRDRFAQKLLEIVDATTKTQSHEVTRREKN